MRDQILEKELYQMSNVNGLSEKARKERSVYMREWRQKNPERVKQAQERFWEKKAKERQA